MRTPCRTADAWIRDAAELTFLPTIDSVTVRGELVRTLTRSTTQASSRGSCQIVAAGTRSRLPFVFRLNRRDRAYRAPRSAR